MEAATKKKRGRPTVEKIQDLEDIMAFIQNDGKSKRTHTNTLYETAGSNFILHHADQIKNSKLLANRNDERHELRTAHAVCEQIGRMVLQDHYSDQDVLLISKTAADLLSNGYTIKQVSEYIRCGRTHGEW